MAWYRCIGSNKGAGGGGGEPCLVSTGHEFFTIPTSIFSAASNYRLEFKLMLLSSDTETCPLGISWTNYGLKMHIVNYANDRGSDMSSSTAWKGYAVRTGGGGTISIPTELGKRQDWIITHDDTARTGSAVVDGVTYQLPNGGSDNNPLAFFGLVYSGNSPWRCCACAFSEIKIYDDNDELIVDLVPMEDSDGNGYYHDEVNGDDYYSLTSNNFRYAIM